MGNGTRGQEQRAVGVNSRGELCRCSVGRPRAKQEAIEYRPRGHRPDLQSRREQRGSALLCCPLTSSSACSGQCLQWPVLAARQETSRSGLAQTMYLVRSTKVRCHLGYKWSKWCCLHSLAGEWEAAGFCDLRGLDHHGSVQQLILGHRHTGMCLEGQEEERTEGHIQTTSSFLSPKN